MRTRYAPSRCADATAPRNRSLSFIDVEFPQDVDARHSSVSIDTPNGQQIFGTGTRRRGTNHGPTAAGPTSVSYAFDGLQLAGGEYLFNAELLASDGNPYDVRWQGAMFAVEPSPSQTGSLLADPRISVG